MRDTCPKGKCPDNFDGTRAPEGHEGGSVPNQALEGNTVGFERSTTEEVFAFFLSFWHLTFLLNKIHLSKKIASFLIKNEGTSYVLSHTTSFLTIWSIDFPGNSRKVMPLFKQTNEQTNKHGSLIPDEILIGLIKNEGPHLNWSGMREPCPNVLQNTHWAMVPSFLNWSLCELFKNKGTWCKSPNKLRFEIKFPYSWSDPRGSDQERGNLSSRTLKNQVT